MSNGDFRHQEKIARKKELRASKYQISHEIAQELLTLMRRLNTKKGNSYSAVVISDAGLDRQKSDPTIASLVVLPNEIILTAGPFTEADKNAISMRTDVETQELEHFAAHSGLKIAAEKLKASGDKSVLLLIDEMQVSEEFKNAKHQGIRLEGLDVTTRNLRAGVDVTSNHNALHNAVHEASRYSRTRNKTVDVHMSRAELEAIQPSIRLFEP